MTADTTTKQWHENTFGQFLNEDVHPTLDWVGDTVPFDDYWGKREKYIHTQGVVGAIKFVPNPQSKEAYTGTFKTGADYGFIRFSTGPPSDPTKPAAGNFAPGFALKFLRDGITSANLVAAPAG